MSTLLQDLRFAARQLIKHRGFTLVAVLTLALGIGANTAIFSVVYGVLLRALPYRAPEQLVGLAASVQGNRNEEGITYNEFRFLAERQWGMHHVGAMTSVGMNLTTGTSAQHLDGVRVSQDYFPTLGVSPMLGRNFSADEDQLHGPSTVILSHALWQRAFGADSTIVGRVVQLDGVPSTVIGVMPAGFESLPRADVWSTLAQVGPTVGSGENLEFIGRLQPGVTLAQVNAHNAVPFADFRQRFHTDRIAPALMLSWRPFGELMVADVAVPVKILFGAIGFVLLIACANVASLVLSRTASRNRELAVRVALGATRTRVVRQILTESALLALLGGLVAVLFASWGLHALLEFVPRALPRTDAVHLDLRALCFTMVVALVTGVIFGLVPAWQMARTDPQSTLKESASRTTGSAAQGRLRNVLVTAEVALALVLLSGAGLMIRTFANLMRTDAGFDPTHLVSAEIWLTGSRYDSSAAVSAFYHQVVDRLTATPGVVSAAVVEAGLPLERGGNVSAVRHGQPVGQNDYRTITPGYFTTLGVRVLLGRDIAAGDDDGAAPVMLVNRAFAHQYLNDAALGEQLSIGGNKVQRTVVGVVGDVRSFVGVPAQPTVYLPSAQTPFSLTRVFNGWYPIHVIARMRDDPAYAVNAMRQAIAAVDPQVPVGQVLPLRDVLLRSLAMQRFVMLLLSAFAVLAIVLAMVGVYGLISWFVVRATRDIGVRIALGAGRGDVLRMVVGRGMLLAGAGVVLGVAGSLALTRLLGSMLYHVKPADPVVLGGVAVALTVVAAMASYLPALRATRVDPLIAMRAD
jgi:putative ABC transport system permease protein